jgi:hypothetical protein
MIIRTRARTLAWSAILLAAVLTLPAHQTFAAQKAHVSHTHRSGAIVTADFNMK